MAIVSPLHLNDQALLSSVLLGDYDMASLGCPPDFQMPDPASYRAAAYDAPAPYDQQHYQPPVHQPPVHQPPAQEQYRFPPVRYDTDYAAYQQQPQTIPLYQPHAVRPIQPLPSRYTPPLEDYTFGLPTHQHTQSWPQMHFGAADTRLRSASFPAVFPGYQTQGFAHEQQPPPFAFQQQQAVGVPPLATVAPIQGGIDGLGALAGSLDLTTGTFYNTQEHPRLRTAQACEACRARKAKCSGHTVCARCFGKRIKCVYAQVDKGKRDKGKHEKGKASKSKAAVGKRGSISESSDGSSPPADLASRRGSIASVTTADGSEPASSPSSDESDEPAEEGVELEGGKRGAAGEDPQGLRRIEAHINKKRRSTDLSLDASSSIYRRRLSSASTASASEAGEGAEQAGASAQKLDNAAGPSRQRALSLMSPPRPPFAHRRTMSDDMMASSSPRAYYEREDHHEFLYAEVERGYTFGRPSPPLVEIREETEEQTPRMGHQEWLNASVREEEEGM